MNPSLSLGQVIPTDTQLGFTVSQMQELGNLLMNNPRFVKLPQARLYIDNNVDKMVATTLAVSQWLESFHDYASLHVIMHPEMPNRRQLLDNSSQVISTIKLDWDTQKCDKDVITIFVALEPCISHEPVPSLKNKNIFVREKGHAWIERMTAIVRICFDNQVWNTHAVSIGVPIPIECVDAFLKDHIKSQSGLPVSHYVNQVVHSRDWYRAITGISQDQVIEKVVLNALGMIK